VLQTEFKHELARYLATRVACVPDGFVPRSLSDIIAYNRADAARTLQWFGQEVFEQAQLRGDLADPHYEAARSRARRLGGADGIDAAMVRHRVDALVAPTTGPAWPIDPVHGDRSIGSSCTPAAVAGLPLVTAPAGFGKTTLAACAVRDAGADAGAGGGEGVHAFWLTLSPDDDDGVRFVQVLGFVLAPTLGDVVQGAMRLLFGRNEPRQALLLLLHGLEKLGAPVLFVLDDFHVVRSGAVRDLMALALEHGPENLHWLVTARHGSPLSLGRLRLQEQVLEIEADDLRLRHGEVEAYLADAGMPPMDSDLLALLEARTQGWIAGLQLALLSLRRVGRGKPVDARALIGHLQGDNALVAEYLTGEVLANLAEPLRGFLLEVSILERLHPDLCVAVTGVAASRVLLREALTQQLFLRSLDGEGQWYELHQLFRELLLRQLRVERSTAELQALYRRAADWYLGQGDLAAALHALLEGGMAPLAAELVQSRSRAALLQDRRADVVQWVGLLPPAVVDERPPLLVDLLWASMFGVISDFSELFARLDGALAVQETPQVLRDEAVALRLLARMMTGDRRNLRGDAMAAVAGMDESSHLALGWTLMVAVLTTGRLQVDSPFALAMRALAEFEAAAFPRGEIIVLGWQTLHYQGVGDSAALVECCRRGMEIVARQPWPDPADGLYFAMSAAETLYWLDRIDEARALFLELLAEGQRLNLLFYQLMASAFLEMCDYAQGRVPARSRAAERLEAERLRVYLQEDVIAASNAQVVLALMLRDLVAGRPDDAWERFLLLKVGLETLTDDVAELIAMATLTAHVARGDGSEAVGAALERMLEQTRSLALLRFGLRLEILRVRYLHLAGRRDVARSALRQVLRSVEKTGYVRMVLDLPALMPLLRSIYTDFARQLTARMERRESGEGGAMLTPQQLSIVRLLAEGLPPEEVAERLVVTQGTLKWHLSQIYRRLGVRNRAQAVAVARSRRLI